MLAIGSSLEAHDPISTNVTWTREISSIFERRCVSCHRPGGYGTFSLLTYQEARPWAVAIKEMVLAGEMPPWGAAPGIGHFANDRRPTRHEQEVIAAWVDGGAPYSREAPLPTPQLASVPIAVTPPTGGIALPLAPTSIEAATQRTASVTLQVPAGSTLTRWAFEPGMPGSVERADLEFASRWLGTWTPGEPFIDFPADAGVALETSATFTMRITYREPPAATVDHSRLRIWIAKEARPKTVREVTVLRSWRTTGEVEILALRPGRDDQGVQVMARFANGRSEPLGVIERPSRGPHPIYRLARPLALPAGARVESTGPVRLLYSAGATRTVKPNVRRRPRR
jgi:hypothetical protein